MLIYASVELEEDQLPSSQNHEQTLTLVVSAGGGRSPIKIGIERFWQTKSVLRLSCGNMSKFIGNL